MVLEPVLCPDCGSNDIVRHGRSGAGKPRYKCRNPECQRRTFIQDYTYRGYLPEVKEQITEMALNGSGIRDTARVLNISPTTVIESLKKRSSLAGRQRSSFSRDCTNSNHCAVVPVAGG